ncbi:MAG: hypothetical protein ACD_28C00357G0004 [uncultured bacterium]|nr:MAG: hypothetical protein ACD_28C00357G0004 [uncultured bacterium]
MNFSSLSNAPSFPYFPEEKIRQAADRFETPFFLYDEGRIRENSRHFREVFTHYFPNFEPLYAIKANPNPHVAKLILQEGFGIDASSESEIWLAQRLGAKGMYTGNYTPEAEMRAVQTSGLLLNLDDISLLETMELIGVPDVLSFRINPGIGKGSMKSNVFAGADAKFGVPFEQAPEAYRRAKAMGVKRFGIHMMTGSNVLDESYFETIVAKLLEIVAIIRDEAGVEIEFLNMGGGFGVPYRPEEKPLDLDRVAAGVRRAFDEAVERYGIREPQLMAEPGRYLTCDAGWLVSRVQVIKDGYKKFVGIDASSNDMPRPSIYEAHHEITVLTEEIQREVVSVVGRICENSDQFAKDRNLPVMKPGDVVAIHNCGAHAHAMGHNYNGRVRHAEIFLREDGSFQLIRRAETIEDLFRTVIPRF